MNNQTGKKVASRAAQIVSSDGFSIEGAFAMARKELRLLVLPFIFLMIAGCVDAPTPPAPATAVAIYQGDQFILGFTNPVVVDKDPGVTVAIIKVNGTLQNIFEHIFLCGAKLDLAYTSRIVPLSTLSEPSQLPIKPIDGIKAGDLWTYPNGVSIRIDEVSAKVSITILLNSTEILRATGGDIGSLTKTLGQGFSI